MPLPLKTANSFSLSSFCPYWCTLKSLYYLVIRHSSTCCLSMLSHTVELIGFSQIFSSSLPSPPGWSSLPISARAELALLFEMFLVALPSSFLSLFLDPLETELQIAVNHQMDTKNQMPQQGLSATGPPLWLSTSFLDTCC